MYAITPITKTTWNITLNEIRTSIKTTKSATQTAFGQEQWNQQKQQKVQGKTIKTTALATITIRIEAETTTTTPLNTLATKTTTINILTKKQQRKQY